MKNLTKHIGVIGVICVLFLVLLPLAGAEGTPAVSVAEVDIAIGSADYKALTSTEEKIPYPISVSADQAEAEEALINIRGNSSRQFGLMSPTKRIPFELKFSSVRPFAGLENKSVKFINSFYPYRLLAEYLALDLFSFAGIPTPAHSLAFIRFNGVDFGLYIAVEDVNKAFLSKWYPEPLNAAYKSTINEEKREEFIDSKWFGHLFRKVTGDGDDHLTELLAALDRGEGYEDYINVEEWLRYFACVAVMGGDGSMLTEQNNFVLYENGGKYDLIPWDLSEAFSGRRTPDSVDRFYLWRDDAEPNPLFDLLMRNQDYKEQYLSYVRELTEGFLAPSVIGARYDALLDAIAPYLPRDHSILLNNEEALPALRSDSPDSFFNLRYMLNASYQNLLAQLEGKADTFAVNPQFADYYEDSYDEILAACEPFSTLLDASLPKQIARKGRSVGAGSAVNGYVWLIGLAAVATVCGIAGLIVRKKKNGASGAGRQASFWQRVRQALARHKVMGCFLLFILAYECVFAWQFGSWEIGEYPYIYHALDYSFGFCARLLPGAVTNFLFGRSTVSNATALETALLLLFFVALSYFLEKLYLRWDPADRPWGLLLLFLFVTGPCSFGIYVKELGMLDAWWLYGTVIVFFLLSHKRLWPLIVAFAFLLPLIYYSSILCFAPFIVIILLYKATVETDLKSRRLLLAVAGMFAVVAIGFTVYFVGFGQKNVRMAPEAFFTLLKARGCTGDVDEIYRVMYSVPPVESGVEPGNEAYLLQQTGTNSMLMAQIVVRLRQHLTIFRESTKTRYFGLLYALLLASPVLALLLASFRYQMKNSKTWLRKFVFFCMSALFFFINLTCLFVSTDSVKWLAHGYTLAFACLLVTLYHESRLLSEKVKPLLRRVPRPVLICYCLMYAVTVLHPYT